MKMSRMVYDWLVVIYVHEIPSYLHQSNAIVRSILGGPPGADVAVLLIRDVVTQVMEPLPAVDAPAGDVVDPGRLAPVNYYRLTVSELQFDERGIAGLVEVPVFDEGGADGLVGFSGEGVEVRGEGRYEGKDGWRHALRASFRRVKAKRRMLVSFSHGAAFGINVDMEALMRLQWRVAADAGGRGADGADRWVATGADVRVAAGADGLIAAGAGVRGADGADRWVATGADDGADGLVADAGGRCGGEGCGRDGWGGGGCDEDGWGGDGRDEDGCAADGCGELPILWTTDLAAELKNCLGGQPIDVLLLNNCYMQCFETGYPLKDQVRFIVAAEGALGAIGYDYAGLMRRLLERPGDDNEALVKGIIGDYAAAISRAEQAGQAVFANRAGEYGNAMVLLERLTALLVERIDEVIDVLADIRENKLLYVSAPLNGYTSNYLCMIDFFSWVNMVFDRLGDLFGGTGLAAEFAALRERMVVAGKVGEGFVEHDAGWRGADAHCGVDGRDGAMGMPIYGYAGLSIFYPRAADWPTLRSIPRCARLVGPWKYFLEVYYARSR